MEREKPTQRFETGLVRSCIPSCSGDSCYEVNFKLRHATCSWDVITTALITFLLIFLFSTPFVFVQTSSPRCTSSCGSFDYLIDLYFFSFPFHLYSLQRCCFIMFYMFSYSTFTFQTCVPSKFLLSTIPLHVVLFTVIFWFEFKQLSHWLSPFLRQTYTYNFLRYYSSFPSTYPISFIFYNPLPLHSSFNFEIWSYVSFRSVFSRYFNLVHRLQLCSNFHHLSTVYSTVRYRVVTNDSYQNDQISPST